MNLVQLQSDPHNRRVAIVEQTDLILVEGAKSIYELALAAIAASSNLDRYVGQRASDNRLDYEAVYAGASPWRLLPALDHPTDPHHCIVSGTGLTHKASAENRQAMHEAQSAAELTDSMQMYLWGVEGGRPEPGQVGRQPEWFYKGTGAVLRGHRDPLHRPCYADDGGEEPEVAAVYVVDEQSRPWRIGLAAGNEFADHVMEKKNYLNLAHSKLRECAIGPELALTAEFESLTGEVSILRGDEVAWSAAIQSGEQYMAHSLANLEHHHFKYAQHRAPGQVHVHFLGAAAFSFGAGVKLHGGDLMQVDWPQLGRPLVNPLQIVAEPDRLYQVKTFSHC